MFFKAELPPLLRH